METTRARLREIMMRVRGRSDHHRLMSGPGGPGLDTGDGCHYDALERGSCPGKQPGVAIINSDGRENY